jgi:cell division protein FtsB
MSNIAQDIADLILAYEKQLYLLRQENEVLKKQLTQMNNKKEDK